MSEANWVVTLFLGALLSIPVGIIANILTRPSEGWLSKRIISSKGKSLSRLKKEYARIKEYHENLSYLQLVAVQKSILSYLVLVFNLLFWPALFGAVNIWSHEYPLTTAMVFTAAFAALISGGWLAYSVNSLIAFYFSIEQVKCFDAYEKETLEKIEKLENMVTQRQ